MKLLTIFGSTRTGRLGEPIAEWANGVASQHPAFDNEFIDLRDWPMPFFNDPKSPSSGDYSDPEVKRWAAKVDEADAILIVTPEYNHSFSAVLKNALDCIYGEWNHKPVGFVSYGASAGGSRAVEQLRGVVAELQMLSVRPAVHVVNFFFIKETAQIATQYGKALDAVLTDLADYAPALASLREKRAQRS